MFKIKKQTTITKDISVVLQKIFLFFSSCDEEIKIFNPFFGSYRLHFSSYKLSALENNLSGYKEDDSAARYFLAKLKRCAYFDLYKFN